jgi:putative sterol carrier protein
MTDPGAVLADLVGRFRSEAGREVRATYQLYLTGDGGGAWNLTIADGKCHLADGDAERPDVTITISLDEWSQLLSGELDALSAYLSGRLQIAGDLSLATRLPALFGL